MNDEVAAETTAAAARPRPIAAEEFEALRDSMRLQIDQLREELAEREEPPQFRQTKVCLKPWGGEGQPPNLLMRLCAVMGDIKSVPKSRKHSQHGYMYASIDDVVAAVRPLLAKHGVWTLTALTSRTLVSFNTTKGVGYNGDFTYDCTLFNAQDPTDCISWEMALLATNPGEKVDGVAQSQAVKLFLILAFNLDRGDDDADSNPSEGPRNTSEAMRIGRQQQRPRDYGSPPSDRRETSRQQTSATEGSGSAFEDALRKWEARWVKICEILAATTGDVETIGRSDVDAIFAAGAMKGWERDMVEATIRREAKWTKALEDLPWTVAELLAKTFGGFGKGFFVLPGEASAGDGDVSAKDSPDGPPQAAQQGLPLPEVAEPKPARKPKGA